MAKLIIQSSDLGKVIPLGGTVEWEVFGTEWQDQIEVAAGTRAKLTLLGEVDSIRLGGNVSDYRVHLEGTIAVFTHQPSQATVRVSLQGEDNISFADLFSPLALRIEGGRVLLGSQQLSGTSVRIEGGSSGSSLDGQGTDFQPVILDAGTGAFNFTDTVGRPNNVRIQNFGADDRITLTGDNIRSGDPRVAISTDSDGNVTIVVNNNGIMSQIELLGVARTEVQQGGLGPYSVQTFNDLAVGDLYFA